MSTKAIGPLLLCLGLVLVAMPRFNRGDLWASHPVVPQSMTPGAPGDHEHYIELVHYLRGESDGARLKSPFAYRVVAPGLASVLPLGAMAALNVVNLAALLIATVLIYSTVMVLTASRKRALGATAMFVFSFPTFYYGTIGYIDPVLILFISAFVFALSLQRSVLAAAVFVLGCLAKEVMLFAVPCYLAYALMSPTGTRARQTMIAVLAVAASIALLAIVRSVIDVSAPTHYGHWLERVSSNASRARTWGSLVLSLGLPLGVLAVLFSRKGALNRLLHHRMGMPLMLGALGGALLVVIAFLTAVVDGRPAWAMYPFMLPMIALMWPAQAATNGAPDR